MAILESVRELASKLGAETNGRDITDQLNKINKHLDETALSGRDIADAVRTYSKNASGGGETFEVNAILTDESLIFSKTYEEIKTAISENKNPVLTITLDDVSIVYSICTYTGSMIVFLGETIIEYGEINQRLVYISPENYHIEKANTNYALQNLYAYLNE